MTPRFVVARSVPVPIWLASVATLLLFLLASDRAPAGAQGSRAVAWSRYDVTIEVRDDGSFRVTERMEIEFSGTPAFTFGFAEIPLGRVEAIEDVSIGEELGTGLREYRQVESSDTSRTPGTFKTVSLGTVQRIDYYFEPTTNQTRTFVLAYDAIGALRVYPNEDPPNEQVYWNAIAEDVTEIGPIRAASVTVVLPTPVDPAAVVLGEDTPGPATDRTDDGQTWRWERPGLGRGDDFVVRMQFPPITDAAPPAWQAADDRAREEEERDRLRTNRIGVVMVLLGGFGLTGGGLWLYRTWYEKGRDPHVGLVADELSEPPDDLPPGLAGTLVDETAQTRELVATMLDLAARGYFVVEPTGEKSFQITAGETRSNRRLLVYERALLSALFPTFRPGSVTDLGKARTRISKAASRIQDEAYDELVARGYFDESPKAVRTRWQLIGGALLAAAAFSGFVIRGGLGWPAVVLAVFLGIAGVTVLLSAKAMPRRTLKGAEAAARWRAFGRYLEAIDRYGTDLPLQRDPNLFERYLPYATAFGHDKEWVDVFARAGAPAPRWYAPPTGGVWWGRPSTSGGGGGGGMPAIPSPQSMSDSAARSLSSVNRGLFTFLNTASTAFTPPSSSGGGGGFSGGGRGGGGGGGGSRGFG